MINSSLLRLSSWAKIFNLISTFLAKILKIWNYTPIFTLQKNNPAYYLIMRVHSNNLRQKKKTLKMTRRTKT